MRFLLASVFSLIVITSLHAQVTVTNSTFFNIGDTLRIARAGNPEVIQAGSAGTDLNWDYSALYKDTAVQIVVKDAVLGNASADFPSADVFQDVGFGETYFKVTPSAITNLGFLTNGFAGVPVMISPKYNPALVEKRSPMNYFDVNTSEASFLISFSTDIVPDTFFTGIPFKPDSIRVNQMIDRLDVVDAWGTLSIPGGDYSVLRERRRTITETTIELQLFGLWVDLGSLGLQFPGVGKDTTLAYHYFSDTEKETIAVVTVNKDDETETLGVQYKDNGISGTFQPEQMSSVLLKGPQPTSGILRFDFEPLTAPAQVDIFSMQGQQVFSRSGLTGQSVLEVYNLSPGTYVYRVSVDGRLAESGTLLFQ